MLGIDQPANILRGTNRQGLCRKSKIGPRAANSADNFRYISQHKQINDGGRRAAHSPAVGDY